MKKLFFALLVAALFAIPSVSDIQTRPQQIAKKIDVPPIIIPPYRV